MNGYEKYEKIKSQLLDIFHYLEDNIKVDLTVSKRSGVAKFNFSESNLGTLIVGSGINSSESVKIKDAYIKITLQNLLRDILKVEIFVERKQIIKFSLLPNLVMMQSNAFAHGKTKKFLKKINEWKNSGAYFTFNTAIDNEITYQISISFVSIENAKENLKSERQFADFDFCQKETQKIWDQNLSKIIIKSDSKDKTNSILYTPLSLNDSSKYCK